MIRTSLTAATFIAAVITLAACGGGGGNVSPVAGPAEPPVEEPEPPIAAPITLSRFMDGFGLWAKIGDETLFRSFIILADDPDDPDYARRGIYSGVGPSSGSPPVSGSAVWAGQAIGVGYRSESGIHVPHHGTARLEADISASRIDVTINFPHLASDALSWRNMIMKSDGTFRGDFPTATSYADIWGAFFGDQHQGAAGSFTSPDMDTQGVFGALRE